MNRLFIDTNIVLDLLIREEYHEDIRALITNSSADELYISYLTVANAAYIMRKYPQSEIRRNIQLILEIFRIIPNTIDQIENALTIESSDFEDILQYQSAKSAQCSVILTRNLKDFKFSSIPVMTVKEYLNLQ